MPRATLTGGDPLQRCSEKVQNIAPVPRGADAIRGCSFPTNADLPTLPDGSPNRELGTSPPSRRRVHDTYWGRRWKGSSTPAWKDGQLSQKPAVRPGVELADFEELQEHEGALRCVFDYMRQWGENTVHDGLFSKQALKFARECGLVDSSRLTTAKLDLMFQRCLHLPPGDGGFIMGKTEMSMEQFQELLVEIAVAKAPSAPDPAAALHWLLTQHVLPFSETLPGITEFEDPEDPEAAAALMAQMESELKFLFQVYSQRLIDTEERSCAMWKEGMTIEQMRAAEEQRAQEKRERYAERAVGLEAMDIRELVLLCEELGVTGSAAHSNKATLVSNREVMRVARSVKSGAAMEKEHGLSYEEFLVWFQRLAVEAFKEEQHGCPSHAQRIERLLLLIDSSPTLAELYLANGSTHRSSFTLAHKIEPMQAAVDAQQAGAAAAAKGLVNQVAGFIKEDPEREEDLLRIFEYYCSFGEVCPRDTMKSQGLNKLARDCGLFGGSFGPNQLDLVHIEAGDKQINPRISFSQWVRALTDIARRRLGEGVSLSLSPEQSQAVFGAACELLESMVRPRAMKAVEVARELALASHPAVVAVLDQMLPLLKRMFSFYCVSCMTSVNTYRKSLVSRDATLSNQPDLGVVGTEVPSAQLMSFPEFVKLSNDFHFVQRVGSMFDLGVYFRASARSSPAKDRVNFQEFLSLIVRCALDYVDLDELEADPEEAAQGVMAFISTFFKAHGVTQLHRSFGDTNPIKRNADPEAFLKWMQDVLAGTSELQVGGRPPLRNMNAPTQLDSSVMEIRAELPDWAHRLLNLPAFKEYVYQVFDGYRDQYPEAPHKAMPAECWGRFCEDAKLCGASFSPADIHTVLRKCVGDSKHMSSTQFLTALWLVSSIKFDFEDKGSRALVRVLREHLLPLLRAGECEEPVPAPPQGLGSPSKARSVLDELQAGVGGLMAGYGTVLDGAVLLGLPGLLEFCSEHRIVPGLISTAQVAKLASTVSRGEPEPLLSESQFVDWVGLCAQLCCKQPELSPSAKVAQLVELIRQHASPELVGDWARPHYKQAYGIGLSNSAPRKITGFSPCKASQELLGVASEMHDSAPPSVQELVHSSGHADELRRIFEFYCGHGAGRPVSKLAGKVLNKMFRECQVYDRRMKYEHMDIVFLEAAGGRRRNPKLTLDLEQFHLALFKTAQRKYPDSSPRAAWEQLLEECILPFASREASEAGECLREVPAVASVLEANRQLIELLFAYYADLDIDPRTSADHLKDAVSMSFRELTLFAKEFGLVGTTYCEGISQVKLAKLFQSVAGRMLQQGESTADSLVPLAGFNELLCRCAMQLLSTAHHGASPEERLATLISKLRAHRSMKPIETWVGRTQTNRSLLHATKYQGTQNLLHASNPGEPSYLPPPSVKSVQPVTRRMSQRAQVQLGKTPTPISFNPDKASNPAMQSCLRGLYG